MAVPSIAGGFTLLDGVQGTDNFVNPGSGSAFGAGGSKNLNWDSGVMNDDDYAAGDNAALKYKVGSASSIDGYENPISPALDLSNAKHHFFAHFDKGSGGEDASATVGGIYVGLKSGSGNSNERAWNCHGRGAGINNNYHGALIDVDKITDIATNTGTFDNSDITAFFALAYASDTGFNHYVDRVGWIKPYQIINGVTGDRGNLETLFDYIEDDQEETGEYIYSMIRESNQLVSASCAFGIGDGSTETWFEDSVKTVEFARHWNLASGKIFAHLSDNAIGMDVNLSASDLVRLSLFTFMSITPWYWDEAGSTSADVEFDTVVIQNAGRVTLLDTWVRKAMIFDSCARVNCSDPDMTACVIQNGAGVKLTGGSNITSLTLTNNSIALTVLATGGNVTFDATGLVFADDNTVDVRWEGASGETLTINAGPNTDVDSGKLSTPNSGTIVINNAVDVTVKCKDEDGTVIQNVRVAVYKTSDDSEIMNELTTALGIATEQINFTTDTAIYWRARKSSTGTRYFPAKGTGTITSSGFSTEVTMIEDGIVA